MNRNMTVRRMKELIAALNDDDLIGVVLEGKDDQCTYGYSEKPKETYVQDAEDLGTDKSTLMIVLQQEFAEMEEGQS